MGRRYVGLTSEQVASRGTPRPWGILGGTFDPIHLGHLAVAEHVRQAMDLAGVLFVPVAQSPHKQARPISPAERRIEMVELAIAGNEAFRVSRMELERPAPSYTVDTLEILHSNGRIAGAGLPDPVIILSVETLPALIMWHRPERLLELCRIAVVPRHGYDAPDPHWLEDSFPGRGDRFVMLDGPDLGHSASAVRARVAAGLSIRYLVTDAVARSIATHGAYGAPGTGAADEGR